MALRQVSIQEVVVEVQGQEVMVVMPQTKQAVVQEQVLMEEALVVTLLSLVLVL